MLFRSYQFVRWSDGSTVNPRIDLAVGGDLAVSAIIEPAPEGSSRTATRIGDRLAQIDALTSTTTATETTYATFIALVNDLLSYLKTNEAVINNLTTEEKGEVITALMKIVTFLMGLLTELTINNL